MSQDPQVQPKKATSPWIWVAVGCGGLTLMAVLVVVAVVGFGMFKARDFLGDVRENPARALAQLAVDSDPDLEIVESDDEDGTFTVRNLETGEVATLNFQDIAEGKLTVTTEEGEVTLDATEADEGGGITLTGPEGEARIGASASLDDVPDWVPTYPDAEETAGTFQMTTPEGVGGMVAQETEEGIQDVLAWFKDWFESEGYVVGGETITSTPEGSLGSITAESEDEGRTIAVTVIESEDGTQVAINYNEGG